MGLHPKKEPTTVQHPFLVTPHRQKPTCSFSSPVGNESDLGPESEHGVESQYYIPPRSDGNVREPCFEIAGSSP